jgi:hypothetical protein
MRKILIFILLILIGWGISCQAQMLMQIGKVVGTPPTSPVISATAGAAQVTIALTSGDVGALTNVLYWDTTSRATYNLYANNISNATLVVASFPGTAYVHTGRTNGTPYYYRLCGTDLAGQTCSSEVTATPSSGSVAPAFIAGHVQSVYANSALTITGVTVHNALIAGMSSGVDLATTTLSGGCGVSWQYSSVIHTTDVYSKVAWCPDATAGSNAVSVTNGGGDFGWGMAEYSGLTAAGTLDGTPLGADTSSANPSSETIVTSYNNSLIIVMCGDEATAGTPTPGAGYTIRVNQNDHYHYMFDHIQTTAGATSMTTTRVASGSWQTLIIGFKAANP